MSIRKRIFDKVSVLSIDYYDREAQSKRERLFIYWVLFKATLMPGYM